MLKMSFISLHDRHGSRDTDNNMVNPYSNKSVTYSYCDRIHMVCSKWSSFTKTFAKSLLVKSHIDAVVRIALELNEPLFQFINALVA